MERGKIVSPSSSLKKRKDSFNHPELLINLRQLEMESQNLTKGMISQVSNGDFEVSKRSANMPFRHNQIVNVNELIER